MQKNVQLTDTTLQVFDAAATGPDADTLLFVHGFPLDHSMWQFQLQELAGRFRLIAPDLRGFGGSAAVDSSPLLMERHADDLAELLDRLEVTTPVTLCGLSMGGYIAWAFERRHTSRLKSMVLCDTKAAPDNTTLQQARHALAARVLEEGPRKVGSEMLQKLFAESTREQQPGYLKQTLDVMANCRKESVAAALRGMAERADANAWLSDIAIPCCVICGEHDPISPPEEMRLIANDLPNATYVEIENAGHMAPLENAPAVNQALLEFLSNSN